MSEKQIVVFQGPSGAGKTFFIRFLASEYGTHFAIVRSPTTRETRGPDEKEFFDFLSDERFDRLVADGIAVPSGEFRGRRYGLYLAATAELLCRKHGLIALTDAGVEAYAASLRLRKRIRIVELRPDSLTTVEENLRRRGLADEALAEELHRAAAWRPSVTRAGTLTMRGARNNLHRLAADLFRQLHL